MNKSLQLKNHLKTLREFNHLSQQELAEIVGTTRQTIIAIEKQKIYPSAKLVALLCLALNCKFEELFYF